MASVQTSSYGGRYIKLTVTETATSIPNNTSTVTWKLESIGGTYNYYTIHNCKVVVNGTTVYNPGTVTASSQKFPASKGSKSGTITVKHNANGTASPISFALHGKVYTSGDENKTGTLSLSTIPRGFTSTPGLSVTSKTETSITCKWTTSETCKKVDVNYMISGEMYGSQYTVYNNSTGATSGTFTITGLDPNTTYKIYVICTKKDSSLTKNSSTITGTTYKYPYISSTNPDFYVNIGSSITLTIYNPLGRTCTVQATGDDINYDTITYAQTSINGTSCSITISSDLIYRNMRLSTKDIYFKVTYSGHTSETKWIRYQCNGSEKPTFNDFDIYDSNTSITSVTENNQVFIKGLSTVCIDIPSNKNMVANYYATPKEYNVNVGNLGDIIPYDANGSVGVLGTINEQGTLTANVLAYDSRNLYTKVSKNITVYDYNPPVVNFEGHRVNDFESNVLLNLDGTYDLLNINGSNINYITMIRRRHKESTSDTWGSWSTMNHDYPNGTFSRTNYALTFDNTKAWDIEIEVSDRFTTVSKTVHIDIGVPIFFIGSNTKQCYKNGEILPNFDEIYPTGSIYLTVNNTFDPNNVFTGVWELVSQGKTLIGVDANDTDFNASQKTGGAKTVSLSTDQLPAHTHGSKSLTGGIDFRRYNDGGIDIFGSYSTDGTGIFYKSTPTWSGSHSTINANGLSKNNNTVDRLNVNATHEHNSVGGGQAHNNMPPYFTCYIWCRTA